MSQFEDNGNNNEVRNTEGRGFIFYRMLHGL